MSVLTGNRLSIPKIRAVSSITSTFRRYPVFAVTILLIVLVLPAIFANVVAPHHPTVGKLSERLQPPVGVA